MTTAAEISKATRGTKRVCQACEVRFYDLSRDPIVCPSCGAEHTPVAPRIVEAGTRGAPFSGKTGWRSKPVKPLEPTPAAEPEQSVPPEAVATEDQAEETEAVAEADAEDDIVLEQEPDDADVSELVDHDVEEPKDR
jgi:uncharacterized protein (TIGR02300 family)